MSLKDIKFEILDNCLEVQKEWEEAGKTETLENLENICDVGEPEIINFHDYIVKRYTSKTNIIDIDENDRLLRISNLEDNTWYRYAYNKNGYVILAESSAANVTFVIRDKNNKVLNIYINNPSIQVSQAYVDRLNNDLFSAGHSSILARWLNPHERDRHPISAIIEGQY